MSLLSRLDLIAETWPRWEKAAQERYWDGLELATGYENHQLGALYLLGYAAEIVLKIAFFRVCNWPDSQTVDFRQAIRHAQWKGYNLHDIDAWANLLVTERIIRESPLDPVIVGQLRAHVSALAANWRESLRYHHDSVKDDELETVHQSASWLLAHRDLLWR